MVFGLSEDGQVYFGFSEESPLEIKLWLLKGLEYGLILEAEDPTPLTPEDFAQLMKNKQPSVHPVCAEAIESWPTMAHTLVAALSDDMQVSFVTSADVDFLTINLWIDTIRHGLLTDEMGAE